MKVLLHKIIRYFLSYSTVKLAFKLYDIKRGNLSKFTSIYLIHADRFGPKNPIILVASLGFEPKTAGLPDRSLDH